MKLYNTLSQKIESINPIKEGELSIYVCGITPYDTAHLGHIRTYSTFDILNRVLTHSGLEVNYIQNITDVDPPLFKKAEETGIPYQEIARIETKKFKEDLTTLKILHPRRFVKVSEEMDKIIYSIGKLISQRNAYVTDNVYFDSQTNNSFGSLSKLNEEEMLSDKTFIKTEINSKKKKNSLDFLLWRKTDEYPNWESPWGRGQPGWHMECSILIKDALGDQIDIHGGGNDLIFPHHECEISQSESLTQKNPLAKSWMHISPLNISGGKMSKSTGNLVFARDILKTHSPEALRLYLASTHYRKVQEYDERELDLFEGTNDLLQSIEKLPFKKENATNWKSQYRNIITELEDDLNTPLAIHELIIFAQKIKEKGFKGFEEFEKYQKLKGLFGI